MKKLISFFIFALLTATLLSNCKDKPKTEITASGTTTSGTDSEQNDGVDTIKVGTPFAKPDTFFVYSNSDDGNVNIRKEPSAKAEIIGKLFTNGKGVRLIDDSGSWWKVETDDGFGFVNSKNVIKRQPEADEEKATTTIKPIELKPIEKDAIEEQEAQSQPRESTSESKTTEKKPSTSEQTSKVNTPQSTSQQTSKNNNKKVFYVVVGSWFDFEMAKTSYGKIPDALEGPIYKVKSNGKTVYRMCSSCHSTKEKAKAEVEKIKRYTNNEIWIWESDGLGECVYTSVDAKGDKMRPLSPR